MLPQWVWIKPHSSSLTIQENLTSKFNKSVLIWGGEKEKVGNNGNCKAFWVTCKAKTWTGRNQK